MSTKHGTASLGSMNRDVTLDSKGNSTRQSESAGTHVDNGGKHDSMASAVASAKSDMANGPRSSGDASYRGSSSHKR